MNRFGLSFHHFGLAVSKPEKAINFLQNMGYKIGEQVFDELQNVNLIMCSGNEMPDVELIFPADTKGPLDKMLTDRNEMAGLGGDMSISRIPASLICSTASLILDVL